MIKQKNCNSLSFKRQGLRWKYQSYAVLFEVYRLMQIISETFFSITAPKEPMELLLYYTQYISFLKLFSLTLHYFLPEFYSFQSLATHNLKK